MRARPDRVLLLSGLDYVYLWADGIHVNIRLEEHKLRLLVIVGVRADDRKELIALADGYRESAESWADLLRDCARRGMRAPVLAVADGALGFWNALREVFPEAREGLCWSHKTANVQAALPKSAHPGAKKALAEIWSAEDKDHALAAVKAFEVAKGGASSSAAEPSKREREVARSVVHASAHLRVSPAILVLATVGPRLPASEGAHFRSELSIMSIHGGSQPSSRLLLTLDLRRISSDTMRTRVWYRRRAAYVSALGGSIDVIARLGDRSWKVT